jgi:segregation and condensation protein A
VSAPGLQAGELVVDLDVFQGPFDLLVTLVLREEVDLWEVSVSRIIADYVLRLADSHEFDLEATSQFVVLVAALLEMKSRLLLDLEALGVDEEITIEEAGEELVAALVRYQQHRNAGEWLKARWADNAGRIYRQAPLPSRFRRAHAGAERLPVTLLANAMAPLLREPPMPDASHITDVAITLVAELRRLRTLLTREGGFTFLSVAPRDRLEKAVTFFALLELHNRGEVSLHQARAFADIRVTAVQTEAALAG